jgi:hypothetical protein
MARMEHTDIRTVGVPVLHTCSKSGNLGEFFCVYRRVPVQPSLGLNTGKGQLMNLFRIARLQCEPPSERDLCVAVFRVVVAGRYLVCRFN